MNTKLAAANALNWLKEHPDLLPHEFPEVDIYKAINAVVYSDEDYDMADLLYLLAFENESEYVLDKIEENSPLAWKVAEAGVNYHNRDARWQIGVLLGRLGGAKAIELLAMLCRDQDEYVRRRALLALREHDLGLSECIALSWLKSKHEYARMVAVDTLAFVDSSELKSVLQKLQNDKSDVVQARMRKLHTSG